MQQSQQAVAEEMHVAHVKSREPVTLADAVLVVNQAVAKGDAAEEADADALALGVALGATHSHAATKPL